MTANGSISQSFSSVGARVSPLTRIMLRLFDKLLNVETFHVSVRQDDSCRYEY